MGTQSPGTVQKTKYMLASALMWLLEKHSFRKISVGDICQEALVSRSAFYVHFVDKYELLKYCLESMLRLQAEQSRGKGLEEQLMVLLESVQENQRALRNVLLADLSQEILEITQQTFNVFVRERLERLEAEGMELPGPIQLLTAFYAGGLANIILCWIQEDFATPREVVARCQSNMILSLLGAERAGKAP